MSRLPQQDLESIFKTAHCQLRPRTPIPEIKIEFFPFAGLNHTVPGLSGEIVVFSYIVYRSRADRDRVMAKVMKDKRIEAMMKSKNIPFDGKRMIVGGFKTMVRA